MALECLRCEKTKPEGEFRRNAARESGYAAYCKECAKAYYDGKKKPEGWVRKTADMTAYSREYRRENKEKARAWDRAKYIRKMQEVHGPDWTPRKRLTPEERAEKARAKDRKRREDAKSDPEKLKAMRARHWLKQAVYRGKVIRQPCFVCGAVAEAHHPTYDLALAVTWLCSEHHREAHELTDELRKELGAE